MVFVFDFRFGQGGFERNRPVNGFFAAVNEALFDEGGEGAHDVRFKRRRFCLIFVFPVGEDAQPFELRRLRGNPGFGKRVAFGAQLGSGDGLVFLPQLVRDLLFDRQTMTIPAGNVGRAETAHRFVAVGDVLENFVERGADMDVAIGKRRTIVQYERWRGGAAALNGVVKAEFPPMRHPARFALRQPGAHRKIGLGELPSIFQVLRHAKEKWARLRAAPSESRGETRAVTPVE